MTRAAGIFQNVWPGPKPFMMWLASIPLTLTGLEQWVHGATTVFGFLTSVLGFGMAVLGVIYWIRRLRRQAAGREDGR